VPVRSGGRLVRVSLQVLLHLVLGGRGFEVYLHEQCKFCRATPGDRIFIVQIGL
jgi:hypothetical protein